MPRFNVNAPDGSIIPVDAPEGATAQDAIAFAAAAYKPSGGIPGARVEKTSSLLDKIRGGVETAAGLTTGIVNAPIIGAAKIYGTLTSGKFGTQEGIQAGEKYGEEFAKQNLYTPRTEQGKQYLENVGDVVAKSGIAGVPLPLLSDLSKGMPAATRAIADVTKTGASNVVTAAKQTPVGQAVQARNARIGQERTAESYQNAGRIDAATQGSKIGLVANPAEMNPTASNRLKAFATDPKVINETAAKTNAVQVPKIALNEMGLPPNTALNSDAPFMAAREAASGPYKQIASLPSMTASPEVLSSIEALRPSKLLLGEQRAAVLNKTIDSSIQELSNGLTGAETVKSISDLRAQAQNLNNAQKAGHPIPATDVDKIKAYRGIADALEQMVEDNVSDPKLLSDLRTARVQIAKIHAYEDATDFNTGKIDPSELAKLTAKNPRLTGDISTIGRFAGNFPEAMGLTTPETMAAVAGRKITRTSMSGALGAAIGSTVGAPIAGMAAGAAAGELGSSLMAKRMVSPSYQASKAIPQDFRPPVVNNLQPGTSNITVFDPVNALVEPGEQPYRKTFTGVSEPIYSTSFRQPALPNEVPRQIYQAQKNAERAQEFKAASERKPASGEVILDFDPITGRYRESSQGIKGATPVVLESTGKAAITAAEKVRTGQQFLMSAEEKIQWGKSLLEGMPIDQGEIMFGKLSPQQITNKMADREWVAAKITKAREQARAFDEIAKRAADAQAKFDANVKRDQMLDLLNTLEDNLRNTRPSSAGGQGPKTREAIRNQLLGGANKNNLRP
jgi:hypothetical protein